MRRRAHAEEHENHERWLVSYADFITLLFAFFVVMYSLSSVNEGKYRVLSDSLVSAFRNVNINTRGQQVAPGATTPAPAPALPQIKPKQPVTAAQAREEERRRQARAKMRDMARDIKEVLAPLVKEGKVSVAEGLRGITVEINASVLFPVGEARLQPAAAKALRAVAEVTAAADFPIVVEGHTDPTPIATPQFPSNWELSGARASSVVRLFADAGVAPQRLTATGYGEQRPVSSNDTPEGRARNRRVTILIEAQHPDDLKELPLQEQ
ncbi:Motility protein B [Gammaproteobacteria bacterium]|nr:flagellar motor protein MotD [Zoogloeaceae bacterium]MCK6385583.1 flagellar motor protein MotD [Rhodocyclaceae bacterium]CAG0945156.1 Motility protein B [Gammaproteobacteria bacterium]